MRQLVYTGLFAALFIVLGLVQIKLGASLVPISLQTLGIALAGIFLKPKQAFIAVFVCIVLGALGLPIFGGKGSLAHILGPTGGFIVYFSIGALLISYFVGKVIHKKLDIKNIIYLFLTYYIWGAFASYAIGIPWFMQVTDSTFMKALTVAFYPFIIGDILKAGVAVLITITLHRYIQKTREGLSL